MMILGLKMQWSLAFLFTFGLVISSPIDSNVSRVQSGDVPARIPILEAQIRALLEELRQIMTEGTDNVPVLDPLEIPLLEIADNSVIAPINITLPDDMPEFSLTVVDLTVCNLSTFVVKTVNVAGPILFINYRVTIDVEVPVLKLDAGQYDLHVSVDDFTIFGKGDSKFNIVGGGVSGSVVVRPRIATGGIFLTLNSVDIKVYLEAFESQVTGLLGGDPNLNAFLNKFLEIFVPEAIKVYENEISDILNTLVLEIGNEILADLNLIDILG